MQTLAEKNEHKYLVVTSPVAPALNDAHVQWAEVNQMQIAQSFASYDIEQARKKVLGVTDVSCLQRYGFKGPQAAKWATEHALEIPIKPNSWTLSNSNALVLRLGGSEFLVEDQFGGKTSQQLSSDTLRVPGVYKVPRADAAFILSGSAVLNLFSELCSLDLRASALLENDLMMTQVAGISATVIRQTRNGEMLYRIWCDGTYGACMWNALLEIANELGGGAVGIASYQF